MQYSESTLTVPGSPFPASLTFYGPDHRHMIHPGELFPAVLICPGGAYAWNSDREAEPVALCFLSMGFNAYVLRYPCAPDARYPIPQRTAAEAMRRVCAAAAEHRTDPDRIFICGFSAGGHLAASLGILWKKADWAASLSCDPEEIRPAGMILGYPVITSGPKAHRGSFENLIGPGGDPALWETLSLEKQVSADTVPAFLWHTRTDGSVPVENSLLLSLALAEHGIPFEAHIYPRGVHGLALANPLTASPGAPEQIQPECAEWIGKAAAWVLDGHWQDR